MGFHKDRLCTIAYHTCWEHLPTVVSEWALHHACGMAHNLSGFSSLWVEMPEEKQLKEGRMNHVSGFEKIPCIATRKAQQWVALGQESAWQLLVHISVNQEGEKME